jgi:hypothetical protein
MQKISPASPMRFFYPARRMFLSGAPDPNPVSGTTDASPSPLVSSPAPSYGAANGNSFAAAHRAVMSEHTSAGNQCHVARSRQFLPLLLRFPAPLLAINSSSPRR